MTNDYEEVPSCEDNIWKCGECLVDGVWPVGTGLLCPSCHRAIVAHAEWRRKNENR